MPDIGQPSASDKNDPDEIRDGVVSDSTRFPGGFIDEQITEAGAAIQIVGQFQLNNASFSQSFDVSPQDSLPQALAFKPDGSQLYVAGSSNNNIYQYGLSTAFDISTASFSQSFDVSTQNIFPTGLAFKPDGSQMYVADSGNGIINQYGLSTAFDVTTASFSQSFDVSPQDGAPTGLAFKPSGSQLYVIGRGKGGVDQYGLSTAFDISTASFSQSFSITSQDQAPHGLAFKPDGSQLYVIGSRNTNVYQYGLSTGFDISTASFVRSLDVSPQESEPRILALNPDGSQLYTGGISSINLSQFGVGFVGAELG